MPGSRELRSQQPERIIGRETELARLRGLVDPAPRASQGWWSVRLSGTLVKCYLFTFRMFY
jgi:hypothetical protein